MTKYCLNAFLNDKLVTTLIEGQLIEIDNFIIENKINNVGDLYNKIKYQLKEKLSDAKLEFVIQYKYKDEIKIVPLIFNQELSYCRNCPDKEKFIYKKMQQDDTFKTMFEHKFIKGLTNAPTGSKIYKKVKEYFDNFNEKTFGIIYNSLTVNPNQKNLNPQNYDTITEYEEAQQTRTYNYNSQRKMFFYAYFFGQYLPKTSMIVSKLSKDREEEMLSDYNLDEFEEQMNFDRNPDDGYRLYGKRLNTVESDLDVTDETNYRKL